MDESTHKNIGETYEEVQDTCLAFDNDLDHDVDNIEIEGNDHVLMAMVHLVDPHHLICTLSMMSRHLVEAFAKNSKPKGFYETVLMTLHAYEYCKGNPNSLDEQLFSQDLARENPK
jgi:hypothetical protein